MILRKGCVTDEAHIVVMNEQNGNGAGIANLLLLILQRFPAIPVLVLRRDSANKIIKNTTSSIVNMI